MNVALMRPCNESSLDSLIISFSSRTQKPSGGQVHSVCSVWPKSGRTTHLRLGVRICEGGGARVSASAGAEEMGQRLTPGGWGLANCGARRRRDAATAGQTVVRLQEDAPGCAARPALAGLSGRPGNSKNVNKRLGLFQIGRRSGRTLAEGIRRRVSRKGLSEEVTLQPE